MNFRKIADVPRQILTAAKSTSKFALLHRYFSALFEYLSSLQFWLTVPKSFAQGVFCNSCHIVL